MSFLKDNWLTILIGVVVGMCSSLVFNLFFLNNSFGNSFDLGGFSGSIIGVIGAYRIAKWQFENSNKASMKLEKEMFVRKNKMKDLEVVSDILNSIDNKFYELQDLIKDKNFKKAKNSIKEIIELERKFKEKVFVWNFFGENEKKLYLELNILEKKEKLLSSIYEKSKDNEFLVITELDYEEDLVLCIEQVQEFKAILIAVTSYNIDQLANDINKGTKYYIDIKKENENIGPDI